MKSPIFTLCSSAILAVLLISNSQAQDNQAASSIPKEITLTESDREGLGITIEMVEMRELPGSDGAVIAIPIDSVLEDNGKTYVVAQSETNEAQFEVWEVTLGVNDERFIEAVSGVFPGDNLVVKRDSPFEGAGETTATATTAERQPQPEDLPAIARPVTRPVRSCEDGKCSLDGEADLTREPAPIRERVHRRPVIVRFVQFPECAPRRHSFRIRINRGCRTYSRF